MAFVAYFDATRMLAPFPVVELVLSKPVPLKYSEIKSRSQKQKECMPIPCCANDSPSLAVRGSKHTRVRVAMCVDACHIVLLIFSEVEPVGFKS